MPMISPNQAVKEAQDLMLDGREPESSKDWALIVNCLAANLDKELAGPACLLMSRIYPMGLDEDTIIEIVEFQLARRD